MENPLLVFVSSVMNEQLENLHKERQAVMQAVKQISLARPWLFEFSPASTDTPEESYLTKVRECDIFVLILGRGLSSAVKREWQEAKLKPRLIFIKTPEVGKFYQDEETRRFISEVDVVYKRFKNIGKLRKEVTDAISDELTKGYRRYGLLSTDVRRSLITPSYLPPPFIPLDRELPEVFIPRETEMNKLRSLLTEQATRETCGITAITGMGGFGKSILARQLCDEDDIKKHFHHGIISTTMPANYQSLTETMRNIGKCLGDDIDYYADHHKARARLEQILEKRAVLIILDDVRDPQLIDRFILKAPQCHLLITTRFPHIVRHLKAQEVPLNKFGEEEAIELLSQITGEEDVPEFTDIAKCLGYHPLALQIAGSGIREGMSPSEWYRIFHDEVSSLKFQPTSDKPEDNVAVSISISTIYLDENLKLLYNSLGIFPEHQQIPRSLILRLWQRLNDIKHLRKLYDEGVFKVLLNTLADLALIEYDEKYVTIHDLLHDYNKNSLGKEIEKVCHEAMLQVLNPDNKEWHLLEEDVLAKDNHYICRFLPYHMEGAGQEDILWSQFRLAIDSLERNCIKPDFLRESLITTIWHSLWNIDKTNKQNDAGTLLVKEWLPRKISNPNSPYTFRIVAVRCACEVDFNEGIALALCHSDKRIRIAALNHIYSLSHYKLKRVLDILRLASDKIVGRFWLPNVRVIQSVLLTLIAVYNQFQTSKGQGNNYDEILILLRKTIRIITQKTVLRLFGPRSRILVSRLCYPFLHMRLIEAEAVSPNNFKSLNAFFSQDQEKRKFAIQSLKYLDIDYGSPGDLQEIVPKLLFNPDNSPSDRISGLIAEAILIAHGITDFSRVEAIVMEIASRDNGNCRALMTATHLLYSIMAQKPETITDRTLIMIKEVVSQWLETSRQFGYGRVKDEYGCYQVFPLSYYAALWMIAKPEMEVDLINNYAIRAREFNDENLQLHIAGMLGESRCVLNNYPIVLKVLKPYFHDIKPNSPMWETLVSSLGSIYNLHTNAVKELLEDASAPSELREEIEAYSYQMPVARLYMRIYQVFVETLASNNSHYIADILEDSLKARNLPTFTIQCLNQIINLLINNNKVPRTGDL